MIDALKPKGKLLTIHAAGNDPANQIIKKIWPKENPFPPELVERIALLEQQMKARDTENESTHGIR